MTAQPSAVIVANTGETYPCPPEATLLDGALAAGLHMPHNCRGGVCGSCKAQILEGAVEHGPRPSIALSAAERAAGYCLCCQSRPRAPQIRLAMVLPMAPRDGGLSYAPVAFESDIVSAYKVTPSVPRLTLTGPRDDGFRFRGGMHVEFVLPGVAQPRPYSIATAPDGNGGPPDGLLVFYVARHESGRASAWLHENARPGLRLRLQGPFGDFSLPAGHDGPVLALAGGTGLAPVLSCLGEALAQGFTQPIRLLMSVRTRPEIFAAEELTRLSDRHPDFTWKVALTREAEAPTVWAKGRIPVLLDAERPDLSQSAVLIAGSAGFVAACNAAARRLGAAPERIAADPFVDRAPDPPVNSIR